jgi:chromosomal replication initiation ATPase DnaA
VASQKEANIRRALVDAGWSPEEITAAVAAHQEEAPTDPTARARSAGIPALYREVRWDEIEEDEARKEAIFAARRWAGGKAPAKGLYLWSMKEGKGEAYGVGKTRIAAAAALQVLNRGGYVRWLDCARLMTDLNLPFRNPQYERAAAKLRAPNPYEVVVLDDVDKMPSTDRNIQPIFALINDCVNEEAPLVITANRDLDSLALDFGVRFGEALSSRLVGHCLDVEVVGRDRRLEP